MRDTKPLPDAEVYVMTVPGLTESFEQRAREMWQAKMPGKELLILGGGVTITPLSHLDAAWREAEAALPEGARIVTTEHIDEGIAFAAVTGDHIVRNVLAYDYTPAEECIAWGAADNPADALHDLARALAALPGHREETAR